MARHRIEDHRHPHDYGRPRAGVERRTRQVVLLTAVTMAAEVGAGWLFNSVALLADGIHMGAHAAALGLAWMAYALARRQAADRRYAFGTWKIEVLGGFTSALMLGLAGLGMIGLSAERLVRPEPIQFDQALIVAGIGLAVNGLSIWLLHPPRPAREGKRQAGSPLADDVNLRAAYLHVAADLLTSVLAIAALLGAKHLGWVWLDPLAGLLGAGLILSWTRSLLIETGGILLDRETDNGMSERIRAALEVPGDVRLTDLHVWKVGPRQYACIAALVADHPLPASDYKARLAAFEGLVHVTIETTACAGHAGERG